MHHLAVVDHNKHRTASFKIKNSVARTIIVLAYLNFDCPTLNTDPSKLPTAQLLVQIWTGVGTRKI
jgi:hypothetical protein